LTIGSGGSAGDFAPSLAIGGLLGGAFGRAMQLLLENSNIDPGAFALVGMGVFYGGIAHVPLAALVLVCELAGNYDLLVPLMLAQGIAFVALRNRALYGAQAASPLQTPAHRDDVLSGVWHNVSVRDAVGEIVGRAPVLCLRPEQEGAEVAAVVQQAPWQPLFPVQDASGGILGVVLLADLVRIVSSPAPVRSVMRTVRVLSERDNLHCAAKILSQSGVAALPVIDSGGRVVGLFGESDLARLYLRSANEAPTPSE
jgi:CIC family chloride channel protein